MELKKIVAIVRKDVLENVEHRLQQIGVPGVSIGQIKGYGEYADFFNRNLTRNARIEIFTAEDKVERIVQTILDAAGTGTKGDGLVAVEPLSRIWRILEKAEVAAKDLEEGAETLLIASLLHFYHEGYCRPSRKSLRTKKAAVPDSPGPRP